MGTRLAMDNGLHPALRRIGSAARSDTRRSAGPMSSSAPDLGQEDACGSQDGGVDLVGLQGMGDGAYLDGDHHSRDEGFTRTIAAVLPVASRTTSSSDLMRPNLTTASAPDDDRFPPSKRGASSPITRMASLPVAEGVHGHVDIWIRARSARAARGGQITTRARSSSSIRPARSSHSDAPVPTCARTTTSGESPIGIQASCSTCPITMPGSGRSAGRSSGAD